MKKHLFPFQGQVEFLGVNSPLLFEGGDGGALGFYLFIFLLLLHFVKDLLFFLTFEGGRRHGFFPLFFCSFLKGERGMSFFHFFLLLNWGSWCEFYFF